MTGDRRRVTPTSDGPVLLEGPVEIALSDGTVVVSDRPVTALCTCHRSRRYPFCDTSHRRRERRSTPAAGEQVKQPDLADNLTNRRER
jgi:CDGSH-type Zn-finger protein